MVLERTRNGRKLLNQRARRAICAAALAGVALTSAIGATVVANGASDLRIDAATAQKMVETARVDAGIPIEMNAHVLEQLNRYLGTPDGRAFVEEALVQMEDRVAEVHEALDRYGLPRELAAIPIVESGYRNLPVSANPLGIGAGLWQFIVPTARRYGLRVDESIDERRVSDKAADAAARYLRDLYAQFGDWRLAIAAYNMGENAVESAIRRKGTRDPWALTASGDLNRYLATVIAAVLIVENRPR